MSARSHPNPQPGQMVEPEDAIYAFIDPPKWSSNAEPPEDNADWRSGYEDAQSNLREALKPWWPLGGPLKFARPTPDGEIGELGRGAMNCPICGLDTPHSHTETEIKHRPDQLAHRLARLATELRVGFYSAAHRTYETDYSRAAERALGIDLRLAADRLETQAADIARLREALEAAVFALRNNGYPETAAELERAATRTDVR